MDLLAPLRSIAPGLDSSVLAALVSSDRALNASDLARIADRGTRPGVVKVLKRLADQGLVIVTTSPSGAPLYRINAEHLLYEVVVSALFVRDRLIERLGREVEKISPALVHASVYGAAAGLSDSDALVSGDASHAEPINLLLIANFADPGWVQAEAEAAIVDLSSRASRWTGNALEVEVVGSHLLDDPASFEATRLRAMLALTFHGPSLESLTALPVMESADEDDAVSDDVEESLVEDAEPTVSPETEGEDLPADRLEELVYGSIFDDPVGMGF